MLRSQKEQSKLHQTNLVSLNTISTNICRHFANIHKDRPTFSEYMQRQYGRQLIALYKHCKRSFCHITFLTKRQLLLTSYSCNGYYYDKEILYKLLSSNILILQFHLSLKPYFHHDCAFEIL